MIHVSLILLYAISGISLVMTKLFDRTVDDTSAFEHYGHTLMQWEPW